jgi:azurin
MMKKLLLTLAILLSPKALAVCEINIGAADSLQFDKPTIEVKRSCGEVTINFSHQGKLAANIMGHNWVLSNEADLQGIAQDGLAAGLNNNYIKAGDSRVLAHTKVIGGGESTSVTFSLDNMTDSEYTYFCSFPGHWAMMKGVLKII